MGKSTVNKLFDLTGKTAVVTGGLGQLGTQYVKTLLEAGVKVAVFDVNIAKPFLIEVFFVISTL